MEAVQHLVQYEHFGFPDEGTCKCDALLLSTREQVVCYLWTI